VFAVGHHPVILQILHYTLTLTDFNSIRGCLMVKSNYTFEKRKKELAKKKKKEEKRLKKLAATGRNDEAGQAESDNDTPDLGV